MIFAGHGHSSICGQSNRRGLHATPIRYIWPDIVREREDFAANYRPPIVLMQDGKLLVPTMPKLAPPPRELTVSERMVERTLSGAWFRT